MKRSSSEQYSLDVATAAGLVLPEPADDGIVDDANGPEVVEGIVELGVSGTLTPRLAARLPDARPPSLEDRFGLRLNIMGVVCLLFTEDDEVVCCWCSDRGAA